MANGVTDAKVSALLHWSVFGQKGEPSDRRVKSTERETSQFESPVTSTWNIQIPYPELPKLLNGFLPRDMDDKWFVYTDGPDAQGKAILHMFRSWTGYRMAELRIEVPLDEDGNVKHEDSMVVEITWESSQDRYTDQTEEGAKDMAKRVCTWVLDAKLE